jgi:L-fuconolactonase
MNNLIVDSHQHFWDLDRFHYYWMTSQVGALCRNFLPSELKPILDQECVNRTVVIQAHQSLEEAGWLLNLASAHEFIGGVVAWADLTSSSLGKTLDELQLHPKFKGIRHPIEDESDDEWMLREDVIRGFAELECRGIPYDLLVWPQHLKYIPALRERCPRLKLVIDHLANPPIGQGIIEDWARDLEIVANLPNIFCKLSGILTQANPTRWTPDDLRPYVTHVVQIFGYDRLMFGTDWPVCTLVGSYSQVVGVLSEVLRGIPEESASRVWGGTAAEFYQLAPVARS